MSPHIHLRKFDTHKTPFPLGRHVGHDSRSRAFSVEIPQEFVPKTVIWPHRAPILNQGRLNSCFPPGTLVRMADGSERPIEDVRLGERVLTAEGNAGRVVRTLLRDETEGVLRLFAWGHSHLRMTAEHPVLTSRGYIPARDLKSGDEIAFPKYLAASSQSISVPDYVMQPSHRLPSNKRWTGVVGRKGLVATAAALPDKIDLDRDFGRVIGLFLAEGNCTAATVQFSFHEDETETLAAEVAGILRRYGIVPHIKQVPAAHGCKVLVHSTGWSRLFSALCGDGAGKKYLNGDVASGSADFLKGVLTGWLDGDGCYRKDGSREGVSISRHLAMAMYNIGQALGMHPVICRGEPTKNRHAAMRQPRWTVSFAPGEGRCRQDDRHVWRKLRHVGREAYVGPVYDLTVEGDHSYVAEGIGVHNCTGNAMTNLLNCVMFAPCRPGANHPWLTEAGAIKLYSQATRNDGFGSDQFYPPHDEGSTGLGVAKAAQNLGFIDSYEHCYTLRELQAALATQPVIVGTDWSMSMFKVDPITGFVTVGKLTDKTIAGGHEYMLQGIDYELKCVVGLNSWGPTWGGGHGLKGGQFRISFDDFADLLSDSGDIIVPKGRGLPAAA